MVKRAAGCACALERFAGPAFAAAHWRLTLAVVAREAAAPREACLCPACRPHVRISCLSQAELVARSGSSREGDQPPRTRRTREVM